MMKYPYYPPPNTRLEPDGSRSMMLHVDIMLDGGTRYYATFHKRMPVRFDLSLGKYVMDLGTNDEFKRMLEQRYPSLRNKQYRIAFVN